MKRLHVDNVHDYPNHPKVKSCGAIVFHRLKGGRAQFLLIKTHEKFGNSWDFPKGAMENGEDETQTAIREVREETGLNVKLVDGFRQEIHYLVKRGEILKTSVYFLGESKSREVIIDPKEVEAYEWLEYDAALEKLTYEHTKEILRKAYECTDHD